MMQQTHNAKLSAVLVNGTWRWKSQIRRFNKNKKQMLFVPPWEFDKITWLFSKIGTYTSMKHRHFKTLSVFVSNTCRCPTQWGHSCMRVLIVLKGKKIFTYLKKFLLIINMFLKILIIVIYVDNLK